MSNQNASSERETSENREPNHVGLSALLGRFVAANDDDVPISEDWLVSIGAEWNERQLHWEMHDDTWPLFVWRSRLAPCVWTASIDDNHWRFDLWTQGCLIRLLLALQRDL